MSDEPSSFRDRYDTSGNVETQYVDAEQTVLVNLKGIVELERLQFAEEESLAKAYARLLSEIRIDTAITCALIRFVHEVIFGELYEWAGRYRTVWISKAGTTWPPPDFLASAMADYEQTVLLSKCRAGALSNDERFCSVAAEMQGEFLVIHPFREGNARTIKLVTNLLAVQSGRPLLLYDQTREGAERYIAAAKAAFRKNYAPLEAVIGDALVEGRRAVREP